LLALVHARLWLDPWLDPRGADDFERATAEQIVAVGISTSEYE
jgi:hypothetical protein